MAICTSNFCINKVKCLYYSGDHGIKNCPVKGQELKKCVNCKQDHTANYGGCPYMMREKKIQYQRAFQNISYRGEFLSASSGNSIFLTTSQ